jgi:hypothetical protein
MLLTSRSSRSSQKGGQVVLMQAITVEWHAMPLRWIVRGPREDNVIEVHQFASKEQALLYRKFRRSSPTQEIAIRKFTEQVSS